MKNGYWLNFGAGWSHLHNDDPAQMLGGASQRIYYDTATQVDRDHRARSANEPAEARPEVALHPGGQWKIIIEATKFVTNEVVLVWSGAKADGNDPVGVYTRVGGLDPLASLTVETA